MNYGFKITIMSLAAVMLLASCETMMSMDPVSSRKGMMKGFGGNMKAMGGFLKTGKGSAADVESRARRMAGSADQIKKLFPKGTSSKDMPGKTRAKPAIWAKKAAFDQAADMMAVYASRMADAAAKGDKKAMGAAMANLGKRGCGGCHSDFRGPKPKK